MRGKKDEEGFHSSAHVYAGIFGTGQVFMAYEPIVKVTLLRMQITVKSSIVE